jgi:hypothetical protein
MFEIASIRSDIPPGKKRVIGVDLFDHEDYVLKDCDTTDEAYVMADAHNRKRKSSMDDVYYVYDDKGTYLRGPEHVGNLGVSP